MPTPSFPKYGRNAIRPKSHSESAERSEKDSSRFNGATRFLFGDEFVVQDFGEWDASASAVNGLPKPNGNGKRRR